jgi:hypothetical protein
MPLEQHNQGDGVAVLCLGFLVMKGQIGTIYDDFWTERLPFFTARYPQLHSLNSNEGIYVWQE